MLVEKTERRVEDQKKGFCECGCEGKTKIVVKTDNKRNHIKGNFLRFIDGHQNNVAKGEKSGASKLIEKNVIKIRQLYLFNNFTYEKLSKKFNVVRTTIGAIIRKETWKHI